MNLKMNLVLTVQDPFVWRKTPRDRSSLFFLNTGPSVPGDDFEQTVSEVQSEYPGSASPSQRPCPFPYKKVSMIPFQTDRRTGLVGPLSLRPSFLQGEKGSGLDPSIELNEGRKKLDLLPLLLA